MAGTISRARCLHSVARVPGEAAVAQAVAGGSTAAMPRAKTRASRRHIALAGGRKEEQHTRVMHGACGFSYPQARHSVLYKDYMIVGPWLFYSESSSLVEMALAGSLPQESLFVCPRVVVVVVIKSTHTIPYRLSGSREHSLPHGRGRGPTSLLPLRCQRTLYCTAAAHLPGHIAIRYQ